MQPTWWRLIKILLVLFALFTTIVCINSEMSKRREAEAAAAAATATASSATPMATNGIDTTAFVSDGLLNVMRNRAQAAQDTQPKEQQPQQQPQHPQLQPQQLDSSAELPAESLDARISSIFRVNDSDGVILFNTTTTDDASFMPISTMFGDQPAPSAVQPSHSSQQQQQLQLKQQQLQEQEQKQKPNHFHHQYQSLNHQQQSFKVQRSPDGKLNLVFNDPLVSLQQSQSQTLTPQQKQPQKPRQPISDTKYWPTSPTIIGTGDHQCVDGFNQSRSFCTKVSNYPDLSGLKGILWRNFSNFFSDEPQLGVRIDGEEDEQYLCKSRVKYLYPKKGMAVDQSWQFIVNTDEFKQGILIEECEGENSSCQFLDSFPNNYMPVCKQHYVVRHLATVNTGSSGQPKVDNTEFKIPSCCKCVIKNRPKA